MSIAAASVSETAIADAATPQTKKVPPPRLTVVAATPVLVPETR